MEDGKAVGGVPYQDNQKPLANSDAGKPFAAMDNRKPFPVLSVCAYCCFATFATFVRPSGNNRGGRYCCFAFQLILSVDSAGRSSMRPFRSSRAGSYVTEKNLFEDPTSIGKP